MWAKVIADSVAPSMRRLVTYEIRLPKCLLAEFNTHRMLSKNAASSRAIPVWKVLKQVKEDPYIPHMGINKSGMQAGAVLEGLPRDAALGLILEHRDHAVATVEKLSNEDWWWHPDVGFFSHEDTLGEPPGSGPLMLHKQTANRYLEPFMYADVVTSGTDWQNFFHLRAHWMAHPDFSRVAYEMEALYWSHVPKPVKADDWHLPYVTEEELANYGSSDLCKFSVARCARVSIENQDGKVNHGKDRERYESLKVPDPEDPLSPVHASPFEHVAKALFLDRRFGNFSGWMQLRKELPNECVPEPRWSFGNPGDFIMERNDGRVTTPAIWRTVNGTIPYAKSRRPEC